jgi:hypothetical protein
VYLRQRFIASDETEWLNFFNFTLTLSVDAGKPSTLSPGASSDTFEDVCETAVVASGSSLSSFQTALCSGGEIIKGPRQLVIFNNEKSMISEMRSYRNMPFICKYIC